MFESSWSWISNNFYECYFMYLGYVWRKVSQLLWLKVEKLQMKPLNNCTAMYVFSVQHENNGQKFAIYSFYLLFSVLIQVVTRRKLKYKVTYSLCQFPDWMKTNGIWKWFKNLFFSLIWLRSAHEMHTWSLTHRVIDTYLSDCCDISIHYCGCHINRIVN